MQSCHLGSGQGPYQTGNSSWQSCPKHFVSKYWGVTLVMSPYIPFSCKPFIPFHPFLVLFCFLLPSSSFLQETASWFLDSSAVYGSSLCPSSPTSSRAGCQSICLRCQRNVDNPEFSGLRYEDFLLTPGKQLGVGGKIEGKYLLPISTMQKSVTGGTLFIHTVPNWTLRKH